MRKNINFIYHKIYRPNMTDIRFSLSQDILEKMKKYPEINWDMVAQGAIENYLEKLEVADKLAEKSNFTFEEADKFGDQVKEKMWQRHKYYLETLKK